MFSDLIPKKIPICSIFLNNFDDKTFWSKPNETIEHIYYEKYAAMIRQGVGQAIFKVK